MKNINKNILIYIIALSTLFLILNSDFIAYCDSSSLFKKMYSNMENYFLNLTWEKAISDPVELSKSIGWISVSGVGALYAFESIWNIRLLGSKFLYNYTPFGHLDDIGGKATSWLGFRNTSGPLKNIIENVPYEEILPLYFARNYIFPKLFINSKNKFTNSNIFPMKNTSLGPELDHTLTSQISPINLTENQLILRPIQPEIIYEERIVYEPYTITDHVYRYRDRENLISLENNVIKLGQKVEDLKFVRVNTKTHEDLLEEILGLSIFEQAITYKLFELKKEFGPACKFPGVTDEEAYFPQPMKIKKIFYPGITDHNQVLRIDFMLNNNNKCYFEISKDYFNNRFPQISLYLKSITNKVKTERDLYSNLIIERSEAVEIFPSYIETKTWASSTFILNPEQCIVKYPIYANNVFNLVDEIVNYQVQLLNIQQLNIDMVVQTLQKKIKNQLLGTKTRTMSTQTGELSDQIVIFDNISSFLVLRDETAYSVATKEGQSLGDNFETARTAFNKIIEVPSKSKASGVEETKESELANSTQTDFTTTGLLALGSLGVMHNIPLIDILNSIVYSPDFLPLLNNYEAVYTLTQVYEANGLVIHQHLQDLLESISIPNSNPQEISDTVSNISSTVTATNINQGPSVLNICLGIGATVLAIGTICYFNMKTGNTTTFTDIPISSLTDLDEIRKSALDLKK